MIDDVTLCLSLPDTHTYIQTITLTLTMKIIWYSYISFCGSAACVYNKRLKAINHKIKCLFWFLVVEVLTHGQLVPLFYALASGAFGYFIELERLWKTKAALLLVARNFLSFLPKKDKESVAPIAPLEDPTLSRTLHSRLCRHQLGTEP